MEAKLKVLLAKRGDSKDTASLKMEILRLEREKEELFMNVKEVIEGGDVENAVLRVETLRRKQVEKSYSELALDIDDRARKFQAQIRAMGSMRQKMQRSLENLVLSIEKEEVKGRVNPEMLKHNKKVLVGILEGRKSAFEELKFEEGTKSQPASPAQRVMVKRAQPEESYSNSMSATPKKGADQKYLNPLFMMDF